MTDGVTVSSAIPIIDIHSHFPMHLVWAEGNDDTHLGFLKKVGALGEAEKHALVVLGGLLLGNWYWLQARTGIDKLKAGGVSTVLSALYPFFEEVDGVDVNWIKLQLRWPPPRAPYFESVEAQRVLVENYLENNPQGIAARVVRDYRQWQDALERGELTFIHAVEGGFAIGDTAVAIATNVRRLASAGAAYVTVAHLFYRQVASNVPPIPTLTDEQNRQRLPVPDSGLTALGAALVRALVANGVFVDLTHLRERSINEVLAIMNELDPDKKIPVIASHAACRFGKPGREYNLTEKQIAEIVERKGTIGLIACKDFMRDGLTESGTVAVIAKHVRQISDVTRKSNVEGIDAFDCISIGTDLDGFIQPLDGLETAAGLQLVSEGLRHEFGDAVANKICHENATRVLRSGQTNAPIDGRIPWAPIP
jgi:microsomal dipeptidase-like Zn-dependent dipeptidase